MPVIQDLSDQITRATGVPELQVEPMARSASNLTMLMRGGGQVFFAKIYTDAGDAAPGALDANQRYDREKAILARDWPVPMPTMLFAADTERVIVTREVPGDGFKHFLDEGRALEALGLMARWVAGFHASAEPQPRDETLWDHFSRYAELKDNPRMEEIRALLEAVPLTHFVLTKGDCTASNFKFDGNGAIGLDFEGAAYRAMEYDLVSMIRGLAGLTGETVEDMVDTVVQQYATVRPIADQDATKAAVRALVEVSDY
jgi:tRNA A-37 threonylcarbamoyl transferase component Bud32